MQTLSIILAIVIGSVIVGGTVVYFLRARFRETVESVPSNLASEAAPVALAEEVKAIGGQIERAMSEQRLQGETQRQLLAQKLDGVRQSVETQRNHVESLRSEMRHESRRRDDEMDEIRTQIGTLQQSVGLPPADRLALPVGTPASPLDAPAIEAGDPPPAAGETIDLAATEPAAPAFNPPLSVDEVVADPFRPDPSRPGPTSEAFELATFEPVSFEVPALATPRPVATPSEGERPEPDAPAFSPPSPTSSSFESIASAPSFENSTPAYESSEPADPFGGITFGDSTATPEPQSATEPNAVPEPAPLAGVFESWEPEAPPQVQEKHQAQEGSVFEDLSFEETSFEEAIVEAPFSQTAELPTFQEQALPELSYASFARASASDAPAKPLAAEGSVFAPPPPAASASAPSAPPVIEAAEAEVPVFQESTFDEAFFAPPATPAPPPHPEYEALPPSGPVSHPASEPKSPAAASPAVDPSWIARPNRSEPSSIGDPAPESASADDFFSLPSAPATPEAPASSGLVDLDAFATATTAGAPRKAPSVLVAQAPKPVPPAAAASAEPTSTDPPAGAASVEEPAPDPSAPEPFVAPENADALTIITSVDEDLQRLLYLEGVTTLEEIAQWGRTRARQIALAVGVSEEMIMNQWIFEAQAAIFNQFSGRG